MAITARGDCILSLSAWDITRKLGFGAHGNIYQVLSEEKNNSFQEGEKSGKIFLLSAIYFTNKDEKRYLETVSAAVQKLIPKEFRESVTVEWLS